MWKNRRLERTALATADRETADREPETPRSSTSPALPNARLNPLLNPLLAKQLGRWAHIYYTASVDKREAAIEKLVCELEAEESRLAGPVPASARETFAQDVDAPRIAGPVLVTSERPEMLAQDPPVETAWETTEESALGHQSFEQPSFEQQIPQQPVFVQSHTESEISQPETTARPAFRSLSEIEERVESVPESVPESWQELLRRTGSAAPEDRWQPPGPSDKIASEPFSAGVPDTGWASTQYPRAFDDLLAKSEPSRFQGPPARNRRGVWIAACVLAVLAGSLWIAQSRRVRPATDQARTPQQPVTAPPAAVPAAAAPSPVASTPAPAATSTINPILPNPGPANHPAPLSQQPAPADSTQPNDPELLAGMRALQGTGAQRNSAEAARHLWQSVKNQNGAALIVLAGLYAQGDGVEKDCDQAKILLDAAGRQAKSHSQFQRVETTRASLRTSGCE